MNHFLGREGGDGTYEIREGENRDVVETKYTHWGFWNTNSAKKSFSPFVEVKKRWKMTWPTRRTSSSVENSLASIVKLQKTPRPGIFYALTREVSVQTLADRQLIKKDG